MTEATRRSRPAVRLLAVILTVLPAALLASCSSGARDTSAGTKSETLRWDGRDRIYSIESPRHLDARSPIVLLLHLFQSPARDTPGFSTFASQARRHGAIVVLPEGVGFTWNAGACCGAAVTEDIDDVGFLRKVVDVTQRQYGRRSRPVYAVGYSNGGFMALRLACEGMKLAGLAVVEASLGVRSCHPRPMNFLQIHQTGDPIVPYLGTRDASASGASKPFTAVPEAFAQWRAAAGCGAEVRRSTIGAAVESEVYDCTNHTRAQLVTIEGGSHGWPAAPADPVDASNLIVAFLPIP